MKFKLIQVFRGVAAMLVVLFHVGINTHDHLNHNFFNNFFNFGGLGLDFFFVLSGFIITYIHFGDLIKPAEGSVLNFFRKRVVRIIPLYWFVAIITTIVYAVITPDFMKQAGLKMDFTSSATLIFLAQSFFLIANGTRGLMGVAWTLSYEFLFYIIFGISIILGFRWAKLIALIWLSLILILHFIPSSENAYTSFYFNILVLYFFTGCLVAYIVLKGYTVPLIYTLLLAVVFLAAAIATIHITGLGYLYIRSLFDIVLLGSFFALLTYTSVKYEQKHPHIKLPGILLLIGDASYSIYLIHNIFLSSLSRVITRIGPNLIYSGYTNFIGIMTFLLAVFAGILMHLLIEKKLLKFVNYYIFSKKAIVKAI